MKVKLAICSPNKNSYSETFIQAHRNIPGTDVKFYFEGYLPAMLEGYGPLRSTNLSNRVVGAIKRKLFKSSFSVDEEALMDSFSKEKINCVIAEFGITGVSIANVCQKLNIPLIVHFHGFDASSKDVLEKFKYSYPKLFEQASAVVAVSKVMEKKLLALGCPKDKLHYNVYGPNDSFFELEPNYNSKLLIAIGRFVDKKAPYYIILSFIEVLKTHPDAKLVIAGDGPLLNVCENLIKHFGVEKSITLTGVINPNQFRSYLQEARAFIQHSITAANGDMEGTPVAILEASAAGLPVISTIHAGISDVIIHEKTGLLVEEHDVIGMAENMKVLLSNKEYATQLGTAGRKNIKENYSMDRHLNKLNELILMQLPNFKRMNTK